MDVRILEKIGLSKNESIIYLTLLKIGMAKVTQILKISKLNSGKVYNILESLKSKGLVSESVIDNIRHFAAAPPKEIFKYIEEKEKELKKEKNLIKKELPNLEKLRTLALPKIKSVSYTGYEGIKIAANEALDSLKKKEEILVMGVSDTSGLQLKDFWLRWHKKRLAKNISIKLIISEKKKYYSITQNIKKREIRLLRGITPTAIGIYGTERVIIADYSKPGSCILIQNKGITKSFITFFNQLWKISKK